MKLDDLAQIELPAELADQLEQIRAQLSAQKHVHVRPAPLVRTWRH